MVLSADVERRLLYSTIGLAFLGATIMLICMGTSYWVILDIPHGTYRNTTKTYLKGHHSGLWRICRIELDNKTQPHVTRK